ncbi:large ribosomal subunit protein mL48 isoform X2 [Brachionichthys hirsutus]|uniref:large ribosomal subunit protein mL48 isoform X2 n=1 Tax=Brachionichthys hirsutus TaxID=412623 RepID=UPI0036050F3E
MNSVILKVSTRRHALVVNKALALQRAPSYIRFPVWASMNERHYRDRSTAGIGRWKHLLPKEQAVKNKEKQHVKPVPVVAATDTEYGTLNVKVSGYDMTLVEHYSQYIHKLCNRLDIKVSDCYALQTKTTEVMLMPEKGNKMHIDSVLKTHNRVVQVSSLSTLSCPIFMEVLLKNQPEGVQLSVMEHTDADFKARFKQRPDLEGLRTQIGSSQ